MSDAALTQWINRTAGLPRANKHHKMQQERGGWWCSCGHYLCGLSTEDLGRKRADVREIAREKHGLHLVVTRNTEGSPRA